MVFLVCVYVVEWCVLFVVYCVVGVVVVVEGEGGCYVGVDGDL